MLKLNLRENFIYESIDYSKGSIVDTYKVILPYQKDDKGVFLNDSDTPIYVKSGKKNLDEYINSFKDECDIYNILSKFESTGDVSSLNLGRGVYADISKIPDNIHDFNNALNQGAEILNTLDSDLRKAILENDIQAINKATNNILNGSNKEVLQDESIKEA
ncbi:minor capsid protein [Capybara microvirus Cap3_SP_613]|nr:minor capsid protein [Capybara microvirus Cap3_SP_613]